MAMPLFPNSVDSIDGVPRQLCPTRPRSAAQIPPRAMLPSPPSAPLGDVLALRVLRHSSRKRHVEPASVSSAENARQDNPDRKLKLGDVLGVFARLVEGGEHRAAMLLVEELVSSDVAQSEFQSTLVMFNRQLVDFVNKHSCQLGKTASEFIQPGGQKESGTKTELDVGIRATKSGDSTVPTRSVSNPAPDRVSDIIQRGVQEVSSTGMEVDAGMGATARYQSKASTRSLSEAGGSMRRSVLQFCRRARNLARRGEKVTSFSPLSDQEIREATPSGRRSACSESSRSVSHSRATYRYPYTNGIIDASKRQHQARGQSYDGMLPSERGT